MKYALHAARTHAAWTAIAAVLVAAALLAPAFASAQQSADRITLAEVLPALAGTDLGALDLGAAPVPGGARVVRATDVRRALLAAGRDARGLDIPRTTRVSREASRLDQDAVERLVRPAVEASLSPCELTELDAPPSLLLPAGTPTVASLGTTPRASGRVTAPVVVTVGAVETRVLISARVVCPPPIIAAGARVQIVVIVGAVRATAPGIVAQPGRRGDQVRVTNVDTRVQLTGRVVDSGTVEVRP